MSKIIYILLFLCLWSVASRGQTSVVADELTRQPVVHANVYSGKGKSFRSAISDEQGRVTVTFPFNRLTVSHLNYEKRTISQLPDTIWLKAKYNSTPDVVVRSKELSLRQDSGTFIPQLSTLREGIRIAAPIAVEHVILCGAQIVSTIIVAPLGTVAIAANSFGITVEALCYMPGYGIADAATTLVGQSLGAGRRLLARSLGRITLGMGMGMMTLMAVVMYTTSPALMTLMTPDPDVQRLTVQILRIEAFAEPMFAASIVCYGIFVGARDTLIPCTMNLSSIWLVRIVLAYFLASTMGLRGVWIAMAVELCFRGIIFLIRFRGNSWLNKAPNKTTEK